MRTSLPAASAALLLVAGSARASSIEPSNAAEVPLASVVAFDEGIGTAAGELIRLYGNDLTVTTCTVGDLLECGSVPRAMDWLGTGPDDFLLTSAHVGRRHTVLTDACHGRVLQVTGNGVTGFNAHDIVDEFADANGGFSPLERPAAALAVGDQLFFTEGRLPDGASNPSCNPEEALEPPHGALIEVEDPFAIVVDPLDQERGEYDQTILISAGDEPYSFHPQASKAMAVYSDGDATAPEFWAVTGWSQREEELLTVPHLTRWQTSLVAGTATRFGDPIDVPFQVTLGAAAVPGGIGQPEFVAPLRIDREPPMVVVGGPFGLVVFAIDGRYLGPLWLSTDRLGPLGEAAQLVSLASHPAGDRIVALFTGANTDGDGVGNRGSLVATWTAEGVGDQLQERRIQVEAGDSPICNREDDGLRCFSAQAGVARAWSGDTVAVGEGFYTEGIFAYQRHFDLVADPVGQAVLFHPDGSGGVVYVEDVKDGTVVIDGFVITGGGGYEVDLGTGLERYGGGILSIGSNLRVKRTLIAHNQADIGGGIAFGGDGVRLELENVGIVDNLGRAGGAIVGAGTASAPSEVVVHRSTIAGNCAETEGLGLGAFTDAALDIDRSIVGFNGDDGPPPRDGDAPLEITNTDLYFGVPTEQDVLDGFGDGNMAVDPLFSDLSSRTLRLDDETPAVVDGEQLGLYGGASGDDLDFTRIPPEASLYCDLPGPIGGDDDDDDDDDDSVGIGGGDEYSLPSGLRCDDCGASMSAADAAGGLLLLPLLAVLRRRGR